MWWKTYFWINLVAFFSTQILILSKTSDPKIGDLVSLIVYGLVILGLYSYSFKKRVFPNIFWSRFFWFYLVYIVILQIYPYSPLDNLLKYTIIFTPLSDQYKTSLIANLMVYILASPIIFPGFYALYKLGTGKKN